MLAEHGACLLWLIGRQSFHYGTVHNPPFQSCSPSSHHTRHVSGLFWPSRLAWLAAGHDEVPANVLVSPRHQTGNTFPPRQDKGQRMGHATASVTVSLCHRPKGPEGDPGTRARRGGGPLKGTSREGMRHGTYYDGALLRSHPFLYHVSVHYYSNCTSVRPLRVPTNRSTPMHHGEIVYGVVYLLLCASLGYSASASAHGRTVSCSQPREYDEQSLAKMWSSCTLRSTGVVTGCTAHLVVRRVEAKAVRFSESGRYTRGDTNHTTTRRRNAGRADHVSLGLVFGCEADKPDRLRQDDGWTRHACAETCDSQPTCAGTRNHGLPGGGADIQPAGSSTRGGTTS